METDTLKKILLYSGVAIFLGLLLTLVPLITLGEFKAENHEEMSYAQSLPERMRGLEGAYGLDKPAFSATDVQVLGVCFAIALVVYVLSRRRIPVHDYRRPIP
jgi:hypothetical protein